jgi:RimJ/RimL family protein N-acetyltransferase
VTGPKAPPVAGPHVRLRDVTLEDADLLDAWNADPASSGEFNDFGGTAKPIDREALARGPLRNERNGQLIVELVADGQPIGVVGFHFVGYGPNAESGAWNIGIGLLPDSRGQGYGTEAQALFAAYLFETTEVNRVEAQTDIDNIAEQRSLVKAGFLREGTIRGAQFRAGAFHDLVAYSILRDEAARI